MENAQIACEFQHDRTVNYAMQQNHVPVVKRLRLTNASAQTLGQMTVTITAEPEFATPWETRLSGLQPAQTVDVGAVDLRLSPSFLASLTERLAGMLVVRVAEERTVGNAVEGPVLFSQQYPIDVLAFDEWGGLSALPEMIAAFVTPNHPDVAEILHDASALLQKWSGDSSISGYQSKDPNRVRLQMAAIYASLQSKGIAYCVPPASFEQQGQKIRTPDAIMEHRLGTCLDLAVVFAACVEAAGLNPLIIFIEGHASPGAWLIDESFSDSVQDDVTLLTKRIAPGVQEICVLESTAFTSSQVCPFEQAVGLGEMNLRDPDRFHFLVDIRRARVGNVRPLPLRVGGGPILDESQGGGPAAACGSAEAPEMDAVSHVLLPEPSRTAERSRLDQWERRLLDLSLRNPLLNFRPTSGSIPLLCPTLSALEDALAEGQDFQIAPRPLDWEATPRDQTVYRRRTSTDPVVQLLNQEFGQHRLRTELSAEELPVRMTRLYRAARTSMEENGANTLYLALGMLVWYETDVSQKPRYAPILLIPMELVRKSVQVGYVLRHGEDEPQLNVTLVEMLRQDFDVDVPSLDELPKDTSGVDVNGVLTRIRRAVMHKRRWDVLDNACLGLFSFNKFVMWHDLKMRSKDLKRNKVVSSLMAGNLQWEPESTPIPEDLDAAFHPKDLLCPMSADSSQLRAICEAGRRSSYVLHGPPGTGKSQTITNIIASSIANGQTVLFVAEKMAALTVVQRRLEGVGLGPFCLEVHSNKSKKKDILIRLQRALDAPLAAEPADWEAEANRLAGLRDELDAHVRALHKRRASGLSIFQILSRLAALRDVSGVVHLGSDEVSGLTPNRLREWSGLAHQLQVMGTACGHPHNNVWSDSRLDTYSPRLRDQCETAVSHLAGTLNLLRETSAPVFRMFGFGETDPSQSEVSTLTGLADRFLSIPGIPGAIICESKWQDTYQMVESWIGHGRARDALRLRLLTKYTEDVLHLDLQNLVARIRDADHRWFLPKMMEYGRIKKTVLKTLRPGKSLADEGLGEELSLLLSLKCEEDFIGAASGRAKQLLGRLWNDGNPDWEAVSQTLQWANEVRRLAQEASGSRPGDAAEMLRHLGQIVATSYERMSGDSREDRQLRALSETAVSFQEAWQAFAGLIAIDKDVLTAEPSAPGWFTRAELRVRRWMEATDGLRDWCNWTRTRNEAASAGLSALVTAYEQGVVAGDEVERAFQRGVCQSLAEYEIENEPALKSFSRVLFEDKIREFRQLDGAYERLTKQLVYARLASRIPRAHGDVSQNSEMGILGRELLKQRNHMALRNLFQRIPNVLPRLTPCLLMSPMSVAQYLDPAHPPFDLVIFDEASQVPTCDAVGAIARADQTIVVGDPKQLPPTSFFMTADPQSDDEGLALEDLESILDDCVALRMPEQRLVWHYRSRHESLIAFSNHQYYDNGLLTFPSPDELTPAISLHHVGGYYDRSKSRQNRMEAEAVVAEIVRRLQDPTTNGLSIGVVTLNQPQQQLIEDLLDEQVLKHPEIEQFFSADNPEPTFVKNLENVQGDERDVIIFSIGYGPDALGRITMNFGPLNWPGGQRRLNVAASRARQEMLVYSSLTPDKIDLSRTNAQGVRDLKAFLEYAQRGPQALAAQISVSSDAEPESIFEEQVCQALRDRGHHVHLQVGCSGYRIDLAVVDPNNQGKYLLGIECDGATYHSAKTARDRDKLRQIVLVSLGWKLLRIWSTDWWENRDSELKRIEDAISEAGRAKASGKPETADLIGVSPVSDIRVPQTALVQDPKELVVVADAERRSKPEPLIAEGPAQTEDPQPAVALGARSKAEAEYVECHLPLMEAASEEFYLPKSRSIIQGQIREVVNTEGPICFDLLARRLASAWGMNRVGSRIQAVLVGAFRGMKIKTTRVDKIAFYWPENLLPTEYEVYRVPKYEKGFRRHPEQMPPEEIAAAALEVLRQQISLPEADLVAQTARLLGYRRTGVDVEQYFRKGVELLKRRGKAVRGKDGKVTLARQ